jgi:hypothetical protein
MTLWPLSNGSAAAATLTLDSLPAGTTWKKAQLFEVFATGAPKLVPRCSSPTALPATGDDACLAGQANFGHGGVEFFVNVLGTGTDPSFTS